MSRPRPAFLPLLPIPSRPPRVRRPHRAYASLSTGNGLPNLRDLSSAAPHLLRPHTLYRGATPSALPPTPSAESLAFLRKAPVLLDLRSNDERATDKRHTLLSSCGPDFDAREVHISLLNKRKIVYGLARALPQQQAQELVWRAMTRPADARRAIVGRMDEGGLLLLNRILVDVGARGIGEAMRVVAEGVGRGGPVYFYCSAGKDRTGLLAALILSALGVPRKDVVSDYARSSETWENGPYALREDYCARLEHAGLTPLKWLGAPPEVMDETLRFIDRRFGSVENYLEHCGFGEDRMAQLRDGMLAA